MPQLVCSDVSFAHGPTRILADIDLTVADGDRIGVVGPNGVGKSTLLALLAGDLTPERGIVRRVPATISVGLATQRVDDLDGESLEELLARRTGVAALEAELAGLIADVRFRELDFERKKLLYAGKVGSELDRQQAENAFNSAEAKVETQNRKISKAQNEINEKREEVKRVRASADAKIADAKAKRQGAIQNVNSLQIEVNEAETAYQRQSTQKIEAPANGTVFRILGAATSDLIKANEPLIVFIPDAEQMAVEFWVRGVDAPLVSEGRKTRLVFDGWPAVQFAGWPSTAVGTFGGIVELRDSQAGPDGRVRMLVTPDPDDQPWPAEPFLLQGVRVTGWVQLDTVSSGYEIWRRLNAFPPTLKTAPDGEGGKLEAKIFDDGGSGSQGK